MEGECFKTMLTVETRDPTLLPVVLDELSRLLETTEYRYVRGPSWIIASTSETLLTISTFLGKLTPTISLNRAMILVKIVSRNPDNILTLVSRITAMLKSKFHGQAYTRIGVEGLDNSF